MALKREPEVTTVIEENDVSTKAKHLFTTDKKKENKILTTFSIEPSFKKELEDLFGELGLGWAAGIRFALKEFKKKYKE